MNNKEPVQLSVNCAKCGATNKFMSDSIPMFCSFCGATLPDMSKHIDEAISAEMERKRNEVHKEIAELEVKKEETKVTAQKTAFRQKIIETIVMLAFLIGSLLFLNYLMSHH